MKEGTANENEIDDGCLGLELILHESACPLNDSMGEVWICHVQIDRKHLFKLHVFYDFKVQRTYGSNGMLA